MSIIDKIKEHANEVSSAKVPENLIICPKCNDNTKNFKFHERRCRIFHFIKGRIVYKVWSFLSRWKCLFCNKTFTYYPEFAMPYKRYVKEIIVSVSRKHLEDDDSSYRRVVKKNNMIIVYNTNNAIDINDANDANDADDADDANADGPVFAHTTPWRWLSYFGSFEKKLGEALDLIRQKSPTSNVYRKVYPINSRKYKSEDRRNLLQRCMQLFNANDELKKLFGISNFFE